MRLDFDVDWSQWAIGLGVDRYLDGYYYRRYTDIWLLLGPVTFTLSLRKEF